MLRQNLAPIFCLYIYILESTRAYVCTMIFKHVKSKPWICVSFACCDKNHPTFHVQSLATNRRNVFVVEFPTQCCRCSAFAAMFSSHRLCRNVFDAMSSLQCLCRDVFVAELSDARQRREAHRELETERGRAMARTKSR